jgi:hypothetical protein
MGLGAVVPALKTLRQENPKFRKKKKKEGGVFLCVYDLRNKAVHYNVYDHSRLHYNHHWITK